MKKIRDASALRGDTEIMAPAGSAQKQGGNTHRAEQMITEPRHSQAVLAGEIYSFFLLSGDPVQFIFINQPDTAVVA